jgi:hypothetical protein
MSCWLLLLQSLDVLAEVVAVTLELSCEELLFGFSLDNWDNYVEQVGILLYAVVLCTTLQPQLSTCKNCQGCSAAKSHMYNPQAQRH